MRVRELIVDKCEKYEPKIEQSAKPILGTIVINNKVGFTVIIKYDSVSINSS